MTYTTKFLLEALMKAGAGLKNLEKEFVTMSNRVLRSEVILTVACFLRRKEGETTPNLKKEAPLQDDLPQEQS